MQFIERDLDVISRKGKENERENIHFRTYLKSRDPGMIDRIVHELNDEITRKIDCTRCGNCCRFLCPGVNDEEIKKLADLENTTPEKYIEENTKLEKFDNTRYLKHKPCKYLKDKKCSIYPDRPVDCRAYPHTHKKDFTSRLWGILDSYEICPIVYNVFERLKEATGFRY